MPSSQGISLSSLQLKDYVIICTDEWKRLFLYLHSGWSWSYCPKACSDTHVCITDCVLRSVFLFFSLSSIMKSAVLLVPLHLTASWRPWFLVSLMQALRWSVLCAVYQTWRRGSRVERHFSFYLPCLFSQEHTSWRVDKMRLPRTRCAKVRYYETWLVLGSARVSHETQVIAMVVVGLSSIIGISLQGLP
jgi:hypothetical protein